MGFWTRVRNTVDIARTEGLKRLNQAKQIVGNKLKKDWDDAKQLATSVKGKVDEAAENIGNLFRGNEPVFAGAGGVGKVDDAVNTVKSADGGHVNFQGTGSSSSKNG